MSSKGLTLVLLWSSLSASQEEKKLANFVAFLFRNVFFYEIFSILSRTYDIFAEYVGCAVQYYVQVREWEYAEFSCHRVNA